MQKHSKSVESTISNGEAMWSMDPQSIESVTNTYRAWFNQASKMRDETLRFAQERFQKELDAAVQLTRCTNPTEAFALQAEFANKMAADYIAESQKFVELFGEIAKEISTPPKSHKASH